MASEIIFYSYALDPNIINFELPVSCEDNTKPNNSYLNYEIIPIYDNEFKQIGVITRVIVGIYNDNINQIEYYENYDYTIWFFNNYDSINFNFNLPYIVGSGSFFIPNIPINSVITNCSGSIWNKKGTSQILPLDNDVKTRIYTIILY